MQLFNRIQVTLAIRNRVIGGIPTDPDLIKGWIAANMPDVAETERAKLAEKTVAELHDAAEERAEGMWTTFKKDEHGIYLEDRQLKAMFKEASNILRDMLMKGEDKAAKDKVKAEPKTDEEKVSAKAKNRYTNLRSKVAERLFVEEEHIYFERAGAKLAKADGNEERAIHVMTAQGPRSALKRYDFVSAPAQLKFTVRYLRDGIVDVELIRTLLEFCEWNGLGADRSQGNGLFKLLEMQPL